MAKFCPECGHPVAPVAKFCEDCGCRLSPSAGGGARPRAQAPGGKQPFPVAEAESQAGVPKGVILVVVLVLVGVGIFWLLTPKKSSQGTSSAAPSTGGAAQSQEQLPAGHPDLSAMSAPTRRDFTADEKREVENLQVLLKTDPKNKDVIKRLADINYDADHFDESIEYYNRYLAIVPDDPGARTDLATMHLYKGEGMADAADVQKHIQMAIDEYKKVLATNPGFENAHFNLAQAYLHQLKKDEAIKELQWCAANAKEPGNVEKAKALLKSLGG